MMYIVATIEAEGLELRMCGPHALMILIPAARVIGIVIDEGARIEVRITERMPNACLHRKAQSRADALLRRRIFKIWM